MTEARDLSSVIDAAQRAAAAGDYTSAEQLLREAARLQETELGPLHPDLANTLNNLGVVCEIADNAAEAELCYRRAYTIATTVLERDHPFVVTSRKNLADLCEARGKTVDWPPLLTTAISSETEECSSAVAPPAPLPPAVEPTAPTPPVSPGRAFRPLTLAAMAGVGIVVVIMVVRPLFRTGGTESSSAGSPTATVPAVPPAGTEPAVPPAGTVSAVPPAEVPRAGPPPAAPGPAPREDSNTPGKDAKDNSGREVRSNGRTASAGGAIVVADAQLCTSLSPSSTGDWRCIRPGDPLRAGPLFFYTRLRSPQDVTVEHRWYRGGQLHKTVDLAIRANPTEGYRTYSRTTVATEGAGDWKVELRTKDGVVLHEESFVVR